MYNTSFIKKILLVASVIFLYSCDKEYNEIGSDLIGANQFMLNEATFNVVAYNQNLYGGGQAVQTNDLPVNSLGFYKNPNGAFGETTASFVTQLQLATVNPTFYKTDINDIIVDSVYMHVPYYATAGITDATTGDTAFTLDSIIGKETNKIKLEVYRSGFKLNSIDPASQFLDQRYYSNQKTVFDTYQFDLLASEPSFEFKNTQTKFYKTGVSGDVRERLAPGIYFDLNTAYFKNNILKAGSANLLNNNAFQDYFQGLYFKASVSTPQGRLARLNFAQGKITIVYHDATSTTNQTTLIRKILVLNMTGKTVNLFEHTYSNPITPNVTSGDDKIYLKGGEGSMAILSLFEGKANGSASSLNSSTDLQKMRNEKWIINDASISFYVYDKASDNPFIATDPEDLKSIAPNRIYLYDLSNNRRLVDYDLDFTISKKPKYSKIIHGGILNNTSGVSKYKISITNYIRSLVKNGGNSDSTKDSTNIKLGLVVTENIGNVANVYLKTPFTYKQANKSGTLEDKTSKFVPSMSVANPLGTILYGSNILPADSNYDKRIKLEIFYTKPN